MASSGRISAKEWERGSDWEVGPVSTRLEIHVVAGLGWAGLGWAVRWVGRKGRKSIRAIFMHHQHFRSDVCSVHLGNDAINDAINDRHRNRVERGTMQIRNHPNPVRQTPSTILPPQILVKRVECRARDAASSFRLGISPDEEYTADEW